MSFSKNIIILCGQYYPDAGAPLGCFLPYIKELEKYHRITIICRQTSSIPLSKYCGSIPFIQLTTWNNSLRYYFQDRIREGKNVRVNTLLLNFVRLYSSFRTMFCYPTQHNWIIPKYLKELNKLEKKLGHIDVIISISFPFCSHIAANKFKISHPQIKWLTYSTDPFAYNECQYERVAFKSHKRKWAKKTEKEVYDNSDANIVTAELYSMLVESFRQPKEKTISFPYLITSALHGKQTLVHSSSSPIRCVYAGSLYIDIRNPQVMLEVFKRIENNIHLILYADGDLNIRDLLKKVNSDRIEINGLVNRTRYERILTEESDVLINIGNTTTLQSPSKLLELVSTGKPIINFYSNKDFGYQVIEKYPLGINVSNDSFDEGSVARIEDFCIENRGKIIDFQLIKELYPNHIMENHMKILNELLG